MDGQPKGAAELTPELYKQLQDTLGKNLKEIRLGEERIVDRRWALEELRRGRA